MEIDPATLQAIDDLHYCNDKGHCSRCHHSYPCDARRLLETVHTLRSREDEKIEGEADFDYDGYEAGYQAGYHDGKTDASEGA